MVEYNGSLEEIIFFSHQPFSYPHVYKRRSTGVWYNMPLKHSLKALHDHFKDSLEV